MVTVTVAAVAGDAAGASLGVLCGLGLGEFAGLAILLRRREDRR